MHPAVSNGTYDVAQIRKDFPALAMQVYGKPLVYLDNAASAQKPRQVLDRIQKAYTEQYANVHRGLHYLANEATEAYEGARESVRGFLNAGRKEEIIFTRNATEAINLVAATFGRERIKEGDEIVLSIMEHHSNIVPWHFLRERHGAVIKWAPIDEDGNFLIDEFEKLLGPRTKMVAITQMSNALGTQVPVKDVVKLAHARGIPVLVDGAQGPCISTIDVRDIDCDFVFTGHKLYGPTGIGVLYGKYDLLAAMPPFNGGGGMIRDVFEDRITYGDRRILRGRPGDRAASGWARPSTTSIPSARRIARTFRWSNTRMSDWVRSIRCAIGNAPDKGRSSLRDQARIRTMSPPSSTARGRRARRHPLRDTLLARYGLTATCRIVAMYNTRTVDVLAASWSRRRIFA